ncbi:MAG: insulinase family protein, partial [Bacteroidales bacterium]|nr:insulinase family protein [Bacteroidales bacterium]
TGTAFRILPKYLYGDNHAYGAPLTGSGFESSIGNITRDQLAKFHQTWLKPNNATLIVVGDITLNELKPNSKVCLSPGKVAMFPRKISPKLSFRQNR